MTLLTKKKKNFFFFCNTNVMKDIFSNQMSKNKMNFNNATTVINKVIIGEIFSTKKKKGNYSF